MPRAQGKILIIRGGAIGDFILTLPVFAALREQFPETHLEVLGYPHIAQLALAGGLVDRMESIEARALAGFFARNGNLDSRLQSYFSEFGLILSYLYDPDTIFQQNVGRVSKAQFISGTHRPLETGERHATEVFLRPLERLAIFDADPVPRLKVTPQSTASNNGQQRETEPSALPCLALHPGSGSERKNWPEKYWAELLEKLAKIPDREFLIIGGEAEGERLMRLAALLPPDRMRLAQSLPLNELALALQGCQAFIGHDSGITHLAAALGLPGLVLWGDTNDRVWAPRSERMTLLRAPGGLAGLTTDQVLRALTEL